MNFIPFLLHQNWSKSHANKYIHYYVNVVLGNIRCSENHIYVVITAKQVMLAPP